MKTEPLVSPVSITRRRTIYPGKENTAVSFNLTALGRALLKELAQSKALSINDFAESLIRKRESLPTPHLPQSEKRTGPKGGARSFFYGKNRGTTTALLFTKSGRLLLEEQVKKSGMSRGDYFDFILREEAGLSPRHGIDILDEQNENKEAIPPTDTGEVETIECQ